jgi:hypothetical protein
MPSLSFRNEFCNLSLGSFQYVGSTPLVSVKGKPPVLKEWGEPIGSDDDIYDLDTLDEFESTKFNSLEQCEEPPLKRRKLDIYPLHDLLPQVRDLVHLSYPPNVNSQPHIHPSSSQGISNTPLNIPRYISSRLTAIPPHTLPFCASPYARTAWLIPVRGSFSWQGSTAAEILDASFSMPLPANPNTGDPLTWTHQSLAAFWSYLIHLRDTRCVGPLGLSFHASDTTSSIWSPAPRSSNTFSTIANQAALETWFPSEQASIIPSFPPPSHVPLSSVDHIKVYHEAPNAMYVRAALFAWLYPPLLPQQKHVDRSSVRIFEGASLVLVDECSRGILIA